MSPKDAIVVMESLEEKYRVLKWRAHLRRAELASAEDTNSFEVLPGDSHSEVTLDPIGRRYFVRRSRVECDGFQSSVDEQAFDGETYREVQWVKHGTTLPTPQDTPGFATITDDEEKLGIPGRNVMWSDALCLGLVYMPPYFTAPFTGHGVQPLSRLIQTWLDEGKDVAVVEEPKGTWTISVKAKVACQNLDADVLLHITYDVTKGGVVTGVVSLGTDKDGHFNARQSRVEIELQQIVGGIWMPKTVKDVDELGNYMLITSYEDVEVNPPVSANTFRLDFPKGVYVTDYVNKMHYVTGDTVDREAATQAFLKRTNTQ